MTIQVQNRHIMLLKDLEVFWKHSADGFLHPKWRSSSPCLFWRCSLVPVLVNFVQCSFLYIGIYLDILKLLWHKHFFIWKGCFRGLSQAFEVNNVFKEVKSCIFGYWYCLSEASIEYIFVVLSVFCFSTRLFIPVMFLVFHSSVYSKALDEEPSNLKHGGREAIPAYLSTVKIMHILIQVFVSAYLA